MKHSEIIYSKLKNATLITDPFPYIYIENFLPIELYNDIVENYPIFTDTSPNNIRLQLCMEDFEKDPDKYTFFLDLQKSIFNKDFFNIIIDKFEPSLKKYNININSNYNFQMRNKNNKNKNSIYFDLQPGINTPVTRKSSVRNPHIDSPSEIFAGLLYLRHPNDDSYGGDLEIYDSNSKIKIGKRKIRKDEKDRIYFQKNEVINTQDLILSKTIPYSSNNFILFLNTPNSIHGVSPRNITNYERRLLNIVYEK